MTAPAAEEVTIRHYEVEGLISVDELPEGQFVLARSSHVGFGSPLYDEAVEVMRSAALASGRLLDKVELIDQTYIDHSIVEKTPFIGDGSIVELWG